MRTIASLKNISSGILFQIINAVLSFISRSVFISVLGTYYLGINSVLLNVITLLSFAELGIGNAINYSLYEPLAQEDNKKVTALMYFYKIAYRNIAIIVSILGFLIFPFLKYFIDDYTPEINIIFLIFLLNNIFSYFLVYKKSILLADQKGYIINKISGQLKIILSIFQIIVLYLTQNYYLYLISQLIMTLIENLYISKKVDFIYPYLKLYKAIQLSSQEKAKIISNTFSLFMYKISGVVINSTDSLVISYFIGTTILGLYSNYTLIFGTVITFLSIIFSSLTASVGNLIASSDNKTKYEIYKMIGLLNFWLYGAASICLINLTEPFLTIWLGKEFLLPKLVLIVLTLNFYTAGMQNANTMFREAGGLFAISRYKPLLAALINIISSLVFVNMIGLPGVLLGTIFSRLCTYFWHDPYIIHKYIFRKKASSYFIDYFRYFVILLLTNYFVNLYFNYMNNIQFEGATKLIIDAIVCCIIINFSFLIFLFRKEEFKSLSQRFLKFFRLKIS